MRWNIKPHGLRRIERQFAFLPIRIWDQWIWLECYYVMWMWYDDGGPKYGWWEIRKAPYPIPESWKDEVNNLG